MKSDQPEVMHIVVTRKDGRVVRRVHVSRNGYKTPSSYYRAIRNTRDRLLEKYPKRHYRVDMVMSHSEQPISLESASS